MTFSIAKIHILVIDNINNSFYCHCFDYRKHFFGGVICKHGFDIKNQHVHSHDLDNSILEIQHLKS